MSRYAAPVATLLILVVAAGNLAATKRMSESLDTILDRGVAQPRPQLGKTEWVGTRGLSHTIETPREANESEAAWRLRHEAVVLSMLNTFPVKQERDEE